MGRFRDGSGSSVARERERRMQHGRCLPLFKQMRAKRRDARLGAIVRRRVRLLLLARPPVARQLLPQLPHNLINQRAQPLELGDGLQVAAGLDELERLALEGREVEGHRVRRGGGGPERYIYRA